jgi:hypothetical protein
MNQNQDTNNTNQNQDDEEITTGYNDTEELGY